MNKNCIRGRHGGASWHNTAKPCGLVVEVNAAVVRRRTAFLPGEISIARGRESGSAVRSNALGDGQEVSRGHSTEVMNRGAERRPFKLRNSQAQLRKDRTGSMIRPELLSKVMNPIGGAKNGEDSGREPERSGDRLPQGSPKGGTKATSKRDHATALLFRKERQRTFVTLRSDLRRPEPPCYGPVWPVVWGERVQSPFLPDSAVDFGLAATNRYSGFKVSVNTSSKSFAYSASFHSPVTPITAFKPSCESR